MRPPVLNQFVHKLDNRYERSLKTTKSSTVKRDRVLGLPSSSQPPPSLPNWMIDPNYKRPTPLATTPTVCMEPAVDPENTSCACVHVCVCVCVCVCVQSCYAVVFSFPPSLPPSLPAVSEDVTPYTSLIGSMQDVRDDSSDFELPESIVS